MFPHGETVTRLRATTTQNPYSGQIETGDWKHPDELLIEHVAWAPSSTVETNEVDRDLLNADAVMYLRGISSVDVTRADRVRRSDGRSYVVTSDPQVWTSPYTGTPQGIVIPVKNFDSEM